MRAEKEAMRQRKAKRNELFPETRAHINRVDLDEPQMVKRVPMTIQQAIRDVAFDTRINTLVDTAIEEGIEPVQVLQDLALKTDLERYTNVPLKIDGPPPEQPEPQPEAEPRLNPYIGKVAPRVRRGRGGKPPITPQQRQEIADAYLAGMPVDEISSAWDIGIGALYQTLDAFGIARRERHPKRGKPLTPEEPFMSEPITSSPPVSPNGAVPGLSEWVVTYQVVRTETTVVAAKSFNDAAQAVEADGVTVTSVARKL